MGSFESPRESSVAELPATYTTEKDDDYVDTEEEELSDSESEGQDDEPTHWNLDEEAALAFTGTEPRRGVDANLGTAAGSFKDVPPTYQEVFFALLFWFIVIGLFTTWVVWAKRSDEAEDKARKIIADKAAQAAADAAQKLRDAYLNIGQLQRMMDQVLVRLDQIQNLSSNSTAVAVN